MQVLSLADNESITFGAGEWAKSVVHCVIDDLPFAEGTLRR